MNKQDEELYRRYLEAKRKGETSVYCADLYPNEMMSAGRRSVKLLDRLFSCTCAEMWDGDGHQPGCNLFPGWNP
jgi:hypothetical protein